MVQPKFGLPRTHKILKADAYASALRMSVCAQTPQFFLHFCAHTLKNEQTHPRPQLGLIVPKKLSKHAVRRNTIKRLSREYFRQHQADLPNGLWALRLRSNINQLPLCANQKKQWALQIAQLFEQGKQFALEYERQKNV